MAVINKRSDNLWTVDGDRVRMLTIPFETRMTVIQLESRELWLQTDLPSDWMQRELGGDLQLRRQRQQLHVALGVQKSMKAIGIVIAMLLIGCGTQGASYDRDPRPRAMDDCDVVLDNTTLANPGRSDSACSYRRRGVPRDWKQ